MHFDKKTQIFDLKYRQIIRGVAESDWEDLIFHMDSINMYILGSLKESYFESDESINEVVKLLDAINDKLLNSIETNSDIRAYLGLKVKMDTLRLEVQRSNINIPIKERVYPSINNIRLLTAVFSGGFTNPYEILSADHQQFDLLKERGVIDKAINNLQPKLFPDEGGDYYLGKNELNQLFENREYNKVRLLSLILTLGYSDFLTIYQTIMNSRFSTSTQVGVNEYLEEILSFQNALGLAIDSTELLLDAGTLKIAMKESFSGIENSIIDQVDNELRNLRSEPLETVLAQIQEILVQKRESIDKSEIRWDLVTASLMVRHARNKLTHKGQASLVSFDKTNYELLDLLRWQLYFLVKA